MLTDRIRLQAPVEDSDWYFDRLESKSKANGLLSRRGILEEELATTNVQTQHLNESRTFGLRIGEQTPATPSSAMSKKKSARITTARAWPYTPEPSPPLKSTVISIRVDRNAKMADASPRARPISMAGRREGVLSPTSRPTLDDVLNNTAPPPYTLAAYTAFLSQQHCLETLEFVTESRKYSTKYDEAAANVGGMPLTTDTDEGFELMQDWTRLLDVYVKPGAPREINLPAEERDDLIEYPYDPKPAPPEALDPAVKRMNDLMSDSIFIPFCNSLKVPTYAQTYSTFSELASGLEQTDPSRLTYDDRTGMHRRNPSNRHRSPPTTSGSAFTPSRSPPSQHRPTQSSALSSGLGRHAAQDRLSTYASNTSVMSESALTDTSSGEGNSPAAGENESVMTPPTTPPSSDLGASRSRDMGSAPTTQPFKPQRSESGGWKRMGMKFFSGNNKKS